MRRSFLLFLVVLLALTGCGGMKPEDFSGTEPRFVLEDFFAGRTRAWGLFQDRFGTVRRQFVVDIEGTWDGETLVLVEDFTYDDGETERRVWRIRKLDDHTYEGRADGVIGTARGKAYGNALNWRYDYNLPIGDDTWRVHFNDWMFLQHDGVMINRATVTKWGLEIGEASIFFHRLADAPTDPSATEQPAPAAQ